MDADAVFNDLHYALHKTFVQDPWLAGKVFRQKSDSPGWRAGQLEIRYKSYSAQDPWPHQLKVRQLKTDWTFQQAGFPSGVFEEDLLLEAPTEGDVEVEGAEIFLCQASFLPGGLLLGMTTFHGAIDASGMLNVQKSWAKNFRELHDRDLGGQIAPSRFSFADQDRTVVDRVWQQKVKNDLKSVDFTDPWMRGLVALDTSTSEDVHAQTAQSTATDHATESSSMGPKAQRTHRTMINRVMFLSSEDLTALHQ